MSDPKLSIITPALNAEKYIAACILSVANQTYKEIEHIIVDWSSTDGTLDIERKYAKEYSHIRCVSVEERGIYCAINKGIDIARGNWIYILGADDTLADDKVLENIFTGHKSIVDNSDFIYGSVIWGNTGKVYDGYFDLQKLYHRNICHQAIFVRKDVFDKIGKFLTVYELLADWHSNILIFVDHKIRKSYIDTVVAKFRLGGASGSKKEVVTKEESIIHDVWLEKVGISELLKLGLNVIIRPRSTIFHKIRFVLYLLRHLAARCFVCIRQKKAL